MLSFKKTIKKVQATFEPAPLMVTAKQVHEDFYSEANSLLSEIDTATKAKAERFKMLHEAGLFRVKDYEDCNGATERIGASQKATYYSHKYPNLKFISESQVSSLCKKYGLFFSITGRYKGDIPENNLLALNVDLDIVDYMSICDNYYGQRYTPQMIKDQYGEETMNKIIAGEKVKLYEYKSQHTSGDVFAWVNRKSSENYMIAATPDMFDITKYDKVEEGYKVVDKDPIVFYKVVGGYLILTAWGDEANIPEIVNEKMN